jgi:hypothetical protein
MADVVTGNTQLSATKNDLIISLVQKELKFAAKLLPYATDFSSFAGKGMKSIGIPKLSSFTVVNRASAAQGDASVLTASKDTMNLDFNAYVAWIVDSADEIESSLDVQIEYMKRAAAAHGRYVDSQLIAKLEASAGLDVGSAPITRDLILDMRAYLLKNEAMLDELALLVHPDEEKVMMKIDEFTRGDAYGSSNIPSGVIGKVYGVPVLVHSGVTSGKAYMWAKSGIGYAFQKQPQMSEQGANEFGSSAKRIAVDQKFGVVALQQGELGTTAPASPLITKI